MTPGSDAWAWLCHAVEYGIERRRQMTIACAWCEADKPPSERAGADGADVSHGICEPHAEAVLADVRARRLARAKDDE